jgi:hypothetical protein
LRKNGNYQNSSENDQYKFFHIFGQLKSGEEIWCVIKYLKDTDKVCKTEVYFPVNGSK